LTFASGSGSVRPGTLHRAVVIDDGAQQAGSIRRNVFEGGRAAFSSSRKL